MKSVWDWRWVLRGFLGVLWIGNGLEKFGVNWPAWFRGGTGDVPGMLDLMADTPILPVRWVIQGLMLPLGHTLTIPVGVIEIGVGLALLIGIGLRWSGMLGALIQAFFWAGFITMDWPFQYPLLIMAHLALAIPAWLEDKPWGAPERWEQLMVGLLGLMWLYEGFSHNWVGLIAAVALAVSRIPGQRWTRIVSAVGLLMGLGLTAMAFRSESWGNFVWAYYTVLAVQGAVLSRRLSARK